MKIGIEAQRIFRENKHGMDYVVLQEILELQKLDYKNEYFIFVAPGPDRCVEDTHNFLIQGNVISHNCDALRYFSIWWTNGAENPLNEKRSRWREDQWEDYENASDEDKKLLIEKWGKPN
jgi:hypothetical protein